MRAWFNHVWPVFMWQLKQDRWRIAIWLVSLVAVTVLTALLFEGLYPSEGDRQRLAHSVLNPAITMLLGPAYGVDQYDIGAIMAHQMFLFTAVATAIFSILTVTKHTREEESLGRMELIRSLPTGRLAPIMATVVHHVLTFVVLAVAIGSGLSLLQFESISAEGAFLYGVGLSAIGLFFAAVTALCAQLAESSRGTVGLAFFVLISAYAIRGLGDVSYDDLSWWSPLGWILETRVMVDNRWWPIGLVLLLAFVLTFIALWLNARRDIGAGLLPARQGPMQASRWLQTSFGFTVTMQRVSMIAWAVGLFIFGATYGSVLGETGTYVAEIELMKEMLNIEQLSGQALIEEFVSMLAVIITIFATVPVVLSMYRLTKEEKLDRLEPVIATATSKQKLMITHVAVAVIFSIIVVSAAGIGMGILGQMSVDGLQFSAVFETLIAYLPAIWVMLSLAALCVGLGKWQWMTWVYLGYAFVVVYLGGALEFPEWMNHISPFEWVPRLPVETFTLVEVISLISVAIVVTSIAVILYRRRDLTG
ncbi:ABC-2 type transport system permease protein [Alkalibacillus flavidus]|uniref:ABC-2 type transport system permease protein n=1 Tax=Alkalibacillus flavidus TaxID=546021 RepID=A0ABV2KWW3_9BACI